MLGLSVPTPCHNIAWQVDMRSSYIAHLQEAKGRLAKLHPDKTKMDILQMARAEYSPKYILKIT